MIPPPDRHAGDRARVELDDEHAALRFIRVLRNIHRYSAEQYQAAEAAYLAARAARQEAYKERYDELERWANAQAPAPSNAGDRGRSVCQ